MAEPALAELCQAYWRPIYAFIRNRGHSAEDTQDLTQSFMIELLDRDLVTRADAERGRFRSFLLGACKFFLSHERERSKAQKRGGHVSILSFDFESGETFYQREPSHDETPERMFERRWALTVLETVLDQLRNDYRDRNKLDQFETLAPFITAGDPAVPYTEVAETLGLTANTAKVAVHRLRQRYRELLRSEVRATLSDSSDVDAELQELLRALS